MQKTLKILVFSARYPDDEDRTKQNHVHNALLSYSAEQMIPTVVDLKPRHEGLIFERFESIDVCRFGVLHRGWMRGPVFRHVFRHKMRQFLEKYAQSYDVILLNTTLTQLLAPLKSIFGVPIVATCHGDEVFPSGNKPLERDRRRLLGMCDAVTAVSDYTADLVRRYIPNRPPVHVILNGIRQDIFAATRTKNKQALRANYKIPSEAFVVLMACTMIERKGVLEVLAAFEKVSSNNPHAFLLCVGRGTLEVEFNRRSVHSNIARKIRHYHYIDSDEAMADLYRMSDLYVMLSKTVPHKHGAGVEGFGISYIDAGALGIPVIGGKSGGVTSAVIDGVTGILLDPSSPAIVDELAATMEMLISSPDMCRKMGEAAERRIWGELTWAHYAKQMRRLFDEILETKRQQRVACS